MKKTIIFILLVLLFAGRGTAQILWSQCPVPGLDTSIRAIGISGAGLIATGFQDQLAISVDNGGSWTICTAWPGVAPSCIAFTLAGDMFVGTYADGVYRSTDDGMAFTQVNNGLSSMNVRCMVMLDNGDILLGTSGGLFRSADNGDSWAAFGTGLPQDIVTALCKGNDNRVYAGTLDNKVYRSNDLGAAWVQASLNLPDTTVITALFENAGWEVYAGLYPQGLYVSANFGNSWIEYNDGLPFSKGPALSQDYYIRDISIWSMAIIIMIFNYGVFTHDYFKMWTPWQLQNTGFPPDPTLSCLAVGPQDQLFAGTETHGLFKYIPAAGIQELQTDATPASIRCIPNPVSSSGCFEFFMPVKGRVCISICDLSGRKIRTVADDICPAGENSLGWNPETMEEGMYLYLMETSFGTISGKTAVIR